MFRNASTMLTLATVAAALAACGEVQQAETPPADTAPTAPETSVEEADFDYVFECGATEVGVTFLDTERMEMTVDEESYGMLRVVSASGARFQAGGDESTVFWIQGESAQLTLNGEDYPECSTL